MKEEQAEIDEARGRVLAVDPDMPFREMPSAWTNQERRDLAVQPVLFAVRARVLDGPPGGIAAVYLAFDHVRPRSRVRIFEFGHERLVARFQGIDPNLPARGTSVFYPPIHT